MTYCGERSLVKYESTRREVASLTCKSWGCPDCFDGRKRRLMAECHAGAPNTFLTLTTKPREDGDRNKAALDLTRAWRLIRLRLMRHLRLKKLPFMAVMEGTKKGWPHLHILLRSIWLDQRLISQWMDELHDSPIVDISRIDNRARVNSYVSKYCAKAAHKFGTAKRYFKSQDYDLRDENERDKYRKKKGGMEVVQCHVSRLARQYEEVDWRITWSSRSRFVAEMQV